MKEFLNRIRSREQTVSVHKQMLYTLLLALLGVALGAFSKFLDTTASNKLPFLLEYLDIRNFLGRFGFWVVAALCIAVYSSAPLRGAVNVFTFFVGMVGSYYLYSKFIAGFFPRSYALIWVGFTAAAPLLAVLCWYAKGTGKIALMLSAVITAVLFNMAFVYGWGYFEPRSVLEAVCFLGGVFALRRQTVKETALMLLIGIGIAFLLNAVVPFRFG